MYNLDKTVSEMKNLGKILIPYSYPNKNAQDETFLTVLKQREIVIDGYDLIVYFNK